MTHLINRLQFEVECPDEDRAFSMRHNFAQTVQLQIASVIDKVCSQYVPGNEWIQIDKVEIDMGQLSPNVFDTEFDKIFLYRFEKELVSKLSGISSEERKGSVQHSMLSLLKHFLKKGVLPWWADEDAINLEEVCKDVFTNSEKLIEQFFLQQANNVIVWQRAAFQLEDNAKKQIVQIMKPLDMAKDVLSKMLTILIDGVSALPDEQKTTVLKKLQWQVNKIDDLIIGNAPAIFAAEDDELLVKKTGAAALLRLFAATPADFELVKRVLNRILVGVDTVQKVDSKIKDEREETLLHGIGNEVKDYGTGLNETTELKKHIAEITDNEADDEAGAEKLLVKGAGIILLAPFLKPFFTKLHLLNADEWINWEAQVKAVYLLKYLGNGPQHYQEYQLVLEKLLCGIPINQPLVAAPELTQAETDEAEDLLHSVLEHWQRLKSTSVNGLRESFFKRDGILTPKENNWQLQVQRKTMDVLLDSIPWGFSTVSLPWNEYIIFTEW
jgi:Contractile injection system tape measure protein